MSFIPKLYESDIPAFTNKYYITAPNGGYSPSSAVCYAPGYKLPDGSIFSNCVGYAISRFMEIMDNTDPNTTQHLNVNADQMFNRARTIGTYQTGSVPQIGSIICWEYVNKQYGHVAVVEDIDSYGNITISHSGYYGNGGGFVFRVNKLSKSTNYNLSEIWGSAWESRTLGFIYNPSIGNYTPLDMEYKIQTAINNALKYTARAFRSANNLSTNAVLYCPFVRYCLSKITNGEEDKLINYSDSCCTLIQSSVNSNLGKWYDCTSKVIPDTGDIICFGKSVVNKGTIKYIDRIGIVIDVDEDLISYGYGDSQEINKAETRIDDVQYFGIYRPNYFNTKVFKQISESNGFSANVDSTPILLYKSYSTNKDATLLQIAGMDESTGKPCINMTGNTKLSVINYTSALGSLLSSFYSSVQDGTQGSIYDDSDRYMSDMQKYVLTSLDSNAVYSFQDPVTFNGESGEALQNCGSLIYNYLVNHKFPSSSAIGILGYMWGESRFQTWAYNKLDGGSGLCQWTDTQYSARATNMYKYVGKDWRNNLTKQMDYLLVELKASFVPMYNFLLERENTYEDMRAAAIRFSTHFGGGYSFYLSLEDALQRYENHYPGATYAHIDSAIWMWNNNLKRFTKSIRTNLKSTIGELK